MSLPHGFLDELRTRVSLADVVGRKVMWDARKSNQGKGDWWAPCPFHQEKSASFHVDDRKGFYYCFGCQAKGDMIGFVMETENVPFIDAVRILATEAGMPMPERDPEAAAKSDRATQLTQVMDQAARWFRLQLNTAAATNARAYLTRRGLSAETIERFEVGFAPNSRDALQTALTAKGIAPDLIAAAGLSATTDDGRAPYDRFRDRIQFPIRDARGRCIAFGGRAMAADAPAKYLNSPETELFKKTYTLYNLGPARAAAGQGQPLIVAEGYMDVIALSQAGFAATVAALGTAVTVEHLKMLWRFCDEPIFALDGDSAGVRAAHKVIDLALPLLEAGKSVRFAMMPKGRDPDDVLREDGIPAMQALIDGAIPMVQLLWARETEGRVLDSPERRAGLDKDLRAVLRTIKDPSIRGHYGDAIAALRQGLFGPRPAPASASRGTRYITGGKRGKWVPPVYAAVPLETTRASTLATQATPETVEILLEGVILAALARHPTLLETYFDRLEEARWLGAGHAHLADALLQWTPETDIALFLDQAGCTTTLETLTASRHIQQTPALRANAGPAEAAPCIEDALAKLDARRGHRQEISEAIEDLRRGSGDETSEALTWRLKEANKSRARSERAVLPTSGMQAEDMGAMSDYLQSLLDGKAWEKKKR
jgi:DNA primase